MKGFAQIPSGAKGLCTNTFDFTGVPGQVSYALNLPGPREGPFDLSANPDIVSWSPCGGISAIMNMNTQCNISPTQQQALIAVCCCPSCLPNRQNFDDANAVYQTGRSHQWQDHCPCLHQLAEVLGGVTGYLPMQQFLSGLTGPAVTVKSLVNNGRPNNIIPWQMRGLSDGLIQNGFACTGIRCLQQS